MSDAANCTADPQNPAPAGEGQSMDTTDLLLAKNTFGISGYETFDDYYWLMYANQIRADERRKIAEDAQPVATVASRQGQTYFCYSVGESSVPVGTSLYDRPHPSIPPLLFEAHDFGQFADDFDQPLAKPIRKAIRDMLDGAKK